MIVKCPVCGAVSDCTKGKYLCDCGIKFYVSENGETYIADSALLLRRKLKRTYIWLIISIALVVIIGVGAVVIYYAQQDEAFRQQEELSRKKDREHLSSILYFLQQSTPRTTRGRTRL